MLRSHELMMMRQPVLLVRGFLLWPDLRDIVWVWPSWQSKESRLGVLNVNAIRASPYREPVLVSVGRGIVGRRMLGRVSIMVREGRMMLSRRRIVIVRNGHGNARLFAVSFGKSLDEEPFRRIIRKGAQRVIDRVERVGVLFHVLCDVGRVSGSLVFSSLREMGPESLSVDVPSTARPARYAVDTRHRDCSLLKSAEEDEVRKCYLGGRRAKAPWRRGRATLGMPEPNHHIREIAPDTQGMRTPRREGPPLLQTSPNKRHATSKRVASGNVKKGEMRVALSQGQDLTHQVARGLDIRLVRGFKEQTTARYGVMIT